MLNYLKTGTVSIALLLSSVATAQEDKTIFEVPSKVICGQTSFMIKSLMEDYKEVPILKGDALSDGVIMTLWSSKKGGTWTILGTRDDISCIIGTGKTLELGKKFKGTFK